MKKLVFIIAIVLYTQFSYSQDSLYVNTSDGTIISYAISDIDSVSFSRRKDVPITSDFVLINGVKWATKNISTPGTFAANSEDFGMYYQWNSKVGWPSAGNIGKITATDGSTTWNSAWAGGYTTQSSTDKWTTANDPSPEGYRVPTLAEIESLTNTTKVTQTWTTQNGIYGQKFTDIATSNSIFLPASGSRSCYDGSFNNDGPYGNYWSSTAYFINNNYACTSSINSDGANWTSSPRSYGFTVRPVAY